MYNGGSSRHNTTKMGPRKNMPVRGVSLSPPQNLGGIVCDGRERNIKFLASGTRGTCEPGGA